MAVVITYDFNKTLFWYTEKSELVTTIWNTSESPLYVPIGAPSMLPFNIENIELLVICIPYFKPEDTLVDTPACFAAGSDPEFVEKLRTNVGYASNV